MPRKGAPYKRTYKHTAQRGREVRVKCGFCGKLVPRWKSFVVRKGFFVSDPLILKQIGRRAIHATKTIVRACPSCARFRGIVQPGKSMRKKRR
jgi:ribosomal protein S26